MIEFKFDLKIVNFLTDCIGIGVRNMVTPNPCSSEMHKLIPFRTNKLAAGHLSHYRPTHFLKFFDFFQLSRERLDTFSLQEHIGQ